MDGLLTLIPCDGVEYNYETRECFIDLGKFEGWHGDTIRTVPSALKLLEVCQTFRQTYPGLPVRKWVVRGDA